MNVNLYVLRFSVMFSRCIKLIKKFRRLFECKKWFISSRNETKEASSIDWLDNALTNDKVRINNNTKLNILWLQIKLSAYFATVLIISLTKDHNKIMGLHQKRHNCYFPASTSAEIWLITFLTIQPITEICVHIVEYKFVFWNNFNGIQCKQNGFKTKNKNISGKCSRYQLDKIQKPWDLLENIWKILFLFTTVIISFII